MQKFRGRFVLTKAKCANDRAETEERCAHGHMRGSNVSSFVTPNRPGAESNLDQHTDQPGDGKSAQRRNFLPMRRNEEPDHSNSDKDSAKTVRHLQPDLRG